MAVSDRPLGRRTLRGVLLGLGLAALGSPALAQTISLDPVPAGAVIYDPKTKTVYSQDKLPNAVGRSVEQTALARGATPEVAAKTAQKVGGLHAGGGLTALIGMGLGGTVGSILVGAGSGCSIGAMFGGPWGCAAGALIGGAVGYLGAQGGVVNITRSGSVQANAQGVVSGSGVRGVSTVRHTASSVWYNHSCLMNNTSCTFTEMQEIAGHAGGVNTTFPCTIPVGWYQYNMRCMVTPVKYQNNEVMLVADNNAAAGLRVDTQMDLNTLKVCYNYYMGNTCTAASDIFGFQVGSSARWVFPNNDTSKEGLALVHSQAGYPNGTLAESIPTVKMQPVKAVPIAGYAFAENIKSEALDEEISPQVVAAIANQAWEAAAAADPSIMPYESTLPVTPASADSAMKNTPRANPTLRDIVATPVEGTEVKGGTATTPAERPQVVVVAPVTAPTAPGILLALVPLPIRSSTIQRVCWETLWRRLVSSLLVLSLAFLPRVSRSLQAPSNAL